MNIRQLTVIVGIAGMLAPVGGGTAKASGTWEPAFSDAFLRGGELTGSNGWEAGPRSQFANFTLDGSGTVQTHCLDESSAQQRGPYSASYCSAMRPAAEAGRDSGVTVRSVARAGGGLALRYAPAAATAYVADWGDGRLRLSRIGGGTYVELASAPVTYPAGTSTFSTVPLTVRFRVSGATPTALSLEARLDEGTLAATATATDASGPQAAGRQAFFGMIEDDPDMITSFSSERLIPAPAPQPTALPPVAPPLPPAQAKLTVALPPGSPPVLPPRPTFRGTALPGSRVTVTVHSDPVECSSVADGSAAWSCTLPSALREGGHTVDVRMVAADGTAASLPTAAIRVVAELPRTGTSALPVALLPGAAYLAALAVRRIADATRWL